MHQTQEAQAHKRNTISDKISTECVIQKWKPESMAVITWPTALVSNYRKRKKCASNFNGEDQEESKTESSELYY